MPALTSLDISSCKKVTEAGESEVLLEFRCFLVASPSTPPPQVPPPFPALSCALCWHTEDERNTPTDACSIPFKSAVHFRGISCSMRNTEVQMDGGWRERVWRENQHAEALRVTLQARELATYGPPRLTLASAGPRRVVHQHAHPAAVGHSHGTDPARTVFNCNTCGAYNAVRARSVPDPCVTIP
jgi:hypothetical protein